MHTAPECHPCFLRQAAQVARITGARPEKEEEIVRAVAQLLSSCDPALSPPEHAVKVYALIAKYTGVSDPFATHKKASNDAALAQLPRLRKIIASAADPLTTAARLAIAGNIIDYGANQDFDLEQAMTKCLQQPPVPNHFLWFRERVAGAKRILYLADNCGELVYDRLFIEQLGKPVTLAVKATAIINDALRADAEACGLNDLCRIIDNGTGCPGTPLESCSQEFQRLFRDADLIVSKGQGNFETLSEVSAPLFFMLLVKCPVVAAHAESKSGVGAGRIGLGGQVMFAAAGRDRSRGDRLRR